MRNLMMVVVILALMPFAACTVCAVVNTAGCLVIGAGSAVVGALDSPAPVAQEPVAPVKKQRKAK